MPHDHANHICAYHEADQATVASAIDGALAAKAQWEALPWNDRAAIFLKAADLVSGKYRYELMAATMLGQGKNAWQAEIDAAAEARVLVPFITLDGHWDHWSSFHSSQTSSGLASDLSRSCISSSLRRMPRVSGSE